MKTLTPQQQIDRESKKVLARAFEQILLGLDIPKPEKEKQLIAGRKFRFDYSWKEGIIVEVDGGTWNGGGHVTGTGYASNAEKLNLAAINGWTILRFTTEMIRQQNIVIEHLEAAFKAKKGSHIGYHVNRIIAASTCNQDTDVELLRMRMQRIADDALAIIEEMRK